MPDENPQDQRVFDESGKEDKNCRPDAKRRECLSTYIGTVVKGKQAAERFNDLLAKTLKIQP
jgi:hypothetical protein